jgi:hypothetical protein
MRRPPGCLIVILTALILWLLIWRGLEQIFFH